MLRRWAGYPVGNSEPTRGDIGADETAECFESHRDFIEVSKTMSSQSPSSFSVTPDTAAGDILSVSIQHDETPVEARDEQDHDVLEQPEVVVCCDGEEIVKGTIFETLSEAKEMCTRFVRCPLKQTSAKKLKYVVFSCFRSGTPAQYESKVDEEFQRTKWSSRIQCPFLIRLKKIDIIEGYQVTEISNSHNHELFNDDELRHLPQNRHIPDEVKEKMISLNCHRILSCD